MQSETGGNITGNEKEFIRLNVPNNVRVNACNINLDVLNCLFYAINAINAVVAWTEK